LQFDLIAQIVERGLRAATLASAWRPGLVVGGSIWTSKSPPLRAGNRWRQR